MGIDIDAIHLLDSSVNLHPLIKHKAAIHVCKEAVRRTNTYVEAREYAVEMLQALGLDRKSVV